MLNQTKSLSLILIALVFLSGCASTQVAKDFSGLSTPGGQPIAHLSTGHIAIHILGKQPLLGDASLASTVADFTQNAKAHNASKVNISNSSTLKLWFIFPPFTIFLTPVITNVAGDAV
jgi:hypothetical protein